MTQIVGEVGVVVRPETRQFRGEATRQLQTAGKDAGRSFARGFATSLVAGAGVAAIGTGLARALRGTVKAAAEQESATLLLQRALRNARAETELFGKSVEDVLKQEALLTGFTDEQLSSAFGRLVTVTRDSEKAFKDLQLAEDIARQRKLGVEAAALALAKAEGGNVTALQRLGVVIPKTITQLKGQERATAALNLVTQRFGGSAEAFAEGTEGTFQRTGFAVEELKETIGFALTPSLKEASNSLREFVTDEENLRRVQEQTAEAVRITREVVSGLVSAFRQVRAVLAPLVDLLGGTERALELAFGFALVRRLRAATLGMRAFGLATTATATQVVAAERTVAAAQAGRGGFFRGRGRAVGVGLAAGTAGALASQGSGQGPGVLTGAIAGGVVGGPAGAAVGAGAVVLSRVFREIPGWDKSAQQLGASVADVAGKFGLAAGAVKVSTEEIAAEAQALVRRIQTDRAEAARFQGARDIARGTVSPAGQEAAARERRRRTGTTSFELRRLRAERTQTQQDDLALFRERRDFLARQIQLIEDAGVRGRNDRVRLEGLYADLNDTTAQITGIEQAAADERAQAAEERKRIAEEEREQARQERQEAAERLRNRRDRARELRDARLQNRVARAQLTETTADDRQALRAVARFYRQQRDFFRRRGALARAEQAEASRLGALSQLQSLNADRAQGGGGAGRFDFFQQAVQEFRSFGSNITTGTTGGILAPQDARGALAAFGLARATGSRSGPDAVAQGVGTLVGQTARQTDVLVQIAGIIRAAWGVPQGNTVERPASKQGQRSTGIADAGIRQGGV